jgi:phospholipid/cholesterol/gamma-HCH transport system substrate-binding protein
MEGRGRLSLVVGSFVIVALGALAVSILSLSSQQGVWRDRYRLTAYFADVQGLIPSAPVWLAGRHVGRVESVDFATRADARQALEVVLQIDRDVQERIRADSVASIGTIGLLGDRYVEISLGTSQAAALGDGGELQTLEPVDINEVIDRGAVAIENFGSLAANLNDIVEDFGGAAGGSELAESVGALTDIVVEVKEGEGLLHSLIYDQYEGSGVESIENSLATLENILSEVAHGDGILHGLIYDAPTDQDLVIEFLEAGSKLNSILAKMNRGEGTLGLLLNDPTLYEELKLLVGGARRSAVVRTMIRMSADEAEE